MKIEGNEKLNSRGEIEGLRTGLVWRRRIWGRGTITLFRYLEICPRGDGQDMDQWNEFTGKQLLMVRKIILTEQLHGGIGDPEGC